LNVPSACAIKTTTTGLPSRSEPSAAMSGRASELNFTVTSESLIAKPAVTPME